MGRSPCCSKGQGLNKGAWTVLEDKTLTQYIALHGQGKWRNIPKLAGLKRCGKSCRLRWLNYLRPDIKRGNITPDEEDLIVRLHKLLGNRWSLIAGRLPGRTDNEVKNYWNTVLSKKAKSPEPEDHQSNVHCFKRKTVTRQSNVEDDKQQNDTKYDRSSSAVSEGHDDLGIDFNQLIGDIDLTEFLNSDYSELDSDASLPQLNLDAGFGSLDLFLQESADKGWMN